VVYGDSYLVSLDAAWISGAPNSLGIGAHEFDNTGAYNNTEYALGTPVVSSANYTRYFFVLTPQNPTTAQIGLKITPSAGAVSVDNVQIVNLTNLPLLWNGSFEYSPIGVASAIGSGGAVDGTTFAGWRLFSVGSPAIAGFTGAIVDAGNYTGGTPGSHAMRLDIDNTGTPAAFDYGLDCDNNRIPVTVGNHYTLSFDLELDGVTGGTMACEVAFSEFDAGGAYLGGGGGFTPALPVDQTFHHYSVGYVPQNANTAKINISFRPRNPGFISALVLDNVVFGPYITVANTVTVYRAVGSATQVKKMKIMSYEPLGLTFVTNSATTTNGATLITDADTIYVPASGVDDSFTYTVTDGYSDATGTVLVKVGAPTGLPVTAFPNGSFESDPYNTAVGAATTYVDTTTFANWRFFTVGSPAIDWFSGTIQDASSTDSHIIQGGVPGSHAMRLDVNNPANPGGADYALDRDNARIAVTYGVTYTYSFDAALHGLTGGSFTLVASIPEFNGAGGFTGSQVEFAPALDAAFRTYSYSWTPLNPATATIAPAFRPYSPGFACAMGLDNVVLHAPVAVTDTVNRAAGLPAKVLISDLLANDTDTENHPLTFVGHSVTTTNGFTLTDDGTWIYIPTNNVADSFTYTITDGLGATNFGTVLIPIVDVFGQTTGAVSVTNSTVTASFAGIPGLSYTVQRATNVVFSSGLRSWPNMLTPTNGLFQVTDDFSDLGGVPAQAFYRLSYP
jgi:hypothetical protein